MKLVSKGMLVLAVLAFGATPALAQVGKDAVKAKPQADSKQGPGQGPQTKAQKDSKQGPGQGPQSKAQKDSKQGPGQGPQMKAEHKAGHKAGMTATQQGPAGGGQGQMKAGIKGEAAAKQKAAIK